MKELAQIIVSYSLSARLLLEICEIVNLGISLVLQHLTLAEMK